MNIPSRLLIGRFLTRSGDQAWDFAVPIVLLKIFPDQLRVAALYYLLAKFASVVLLPRVATLIDTKPKQLVVRIALLLQLVGVLTGAVSIYAFWYSGISTVSWDVAFSLRFCFLLFSGIVASLGSALMDISIANDLAPSLLSDDRLASFNSRFRQVDLATEVGSPIVAGLLLAFSSDGFAHAGFIAIALWNVISFIPEYLILQSIFRDRPELAKKTVAVSESAKISVVGKLKNGWVAFFREPVALAVLAYALLWLSALSPHGVLLTGFLQDGWKLPEWVIGTFRGSGALFGLFATLLFPMALKRFGLNLASYYFLLFQCVVVVAACAVFFIGGSASHVLFLTLILFSRIGLYGFSLGEMQIRQEGIGANVRGQVNGFANALTGVATLGLFGFGAALPSTDDFGILVGISTAAVVLGFLVFHIWIGKQRAPQVSRP